MSIFNLVGGKATTIEETKLLAEMWEDRFFLPDIIHGCDDYVIRVYLNDSHSEASTDHNQWEVEYIWRNDIIQADLNNKSDDTKFWDAISQTLESFGVNSTENDFKEIVYEWPKAIKMTRDELVKWARKEKDYGKI